MSVTPHDELHALLQAKEDEHLEFKEAKQGFDFDKLVKYCSALANEGGGKIVFGITNNHPRAVVGSRAFEDLEKTKLGLIDNLHLRITSQEIAHRVGRILVFSVPSRPIGMPVPYKGAYWMRSGESLITMTPDMLKRIFAESGPDYSAEICPSAKLGDLDAGALRIFRGLWQRKSGNTALDNISDEQLLADAELTICGNITYAALILLGTRQALGKYLPQAEVIFEYRSSDVSGPAQQREDYREGLFLVEEKLWAVINLRNDIQHFQDGLFIWDIATFNETAVREAILNAVCHRDYRMQGSIFVRQYSRRLEIVSPGGFPSGITIDNILWRQAPRNRRIAEVLAKCGLVERSGQGVNRMYEECIRESKPTPDFTGTDAYQVSLSLHGEIQSPEFLRFLEKVGRERLASFTTQDFLALDLVHREQAIPQELKDRMPILIEQGVIEKAGRAKHILSRAFYSFLGKSGVYTRKKGLDKETNKELLYRHIRENHKEGSKLQELLQVLPAISRNQVQKLLKELKLEKRIHKVGITKASRWYPGQHQD